MWTEASVSCTCRKRYINWPNSMLSGFIILFWSFVPCRGEATLKVRIAFLCSKRRKAFPYAPNIFSTGNNEQSSKFIPPEAKWPGKQALVKVHQLFPISKHYKNKRFSTQCTVHTTESVPSWGSCQLGFPNVPWHNIVEQTVKASVIWSSIWHAFQTAICKEDGICGKVFCCSPRVWFGSCGAIA